ncbi:MAG: O-antigen ligase family protein, partial [Patescibacteria group bacterium]
AIIGLLVGLFVVGAFLIFSDILAKKRYRVFVAVLMLVIILSVAVMFLFKDSEFVKNSTYLKRFSDISLSATTAQTRILTWQSAIKGFFAAPILGAGPENFSYLFNANYNPRLLMYGGGSFAETWQDKPHNAFIEILTETGIIGSLSYILIWVFVAVYLFKIFRKGEKFLSLILAAAFIAYFGAIFFSFDSFGSWFGLYLFLALLILS